MLTDVYENYSNKVDIWISIFMQIHIIYSDFCSDLSLMNSKHTRNDNKMTTFAKQRTSIYNRLPVSDY